jgi:hypothetical protein
MSVSVNHVVYNFHGGVHAPNRGTDVGQEMCEMRTRALDHHPDGRQFVVEEHARQHPTQVQRPEVLGGRVLVRVHHAEAVRGEHVRRNDFDEILKYPRVCCVFDQAYARCQRAEASTRRQTTGTRGVKTLELHVSKHSSITESDRQTDGLSHHHAIIFIDSHFNTNSVATKTKK